MSKIQTTPGQILTLWKTIFYELAPGTTKEFLESEEVQRLSYYPWEVINTAIRGNSVTLSEILEKTINLTDHERNKEYYRSWLKANFAEEEPESALEIGSYLLRNNIYS